MRTILVLVLLASTAHADHRPYTRKTTAPVVKQAAAPKTPPPPAKPAVTAATIIQQEEDNQPIYVEQEQILEQLVKDTPDDEVDKADLMFRLAEHYAKQWRFWTIEQNDQQLGKS